MKTADGLQDREAIEALIRQARQDRDAALGRAMIDVADTVSRWIDAAGRVLTQASRDASHQRVAMKVVGAVFIAALALVSFHSMARVGAPHVVPTLTPPQGETILFRAFADGVQVYECGEGASGPQWVFKGPEASLVDDRSVPLGRHYAGPTWESIDGSRVVGRVVASVDANDPGAIAHLLLKAQSHAGAGVFANVRSIQRLQTVGGRAPNEACTAMDRGREARVPYSATYYFYGELASGSTL